MFLVDYGVCTGYQRCMDVCPADAILLLQDEK